MIGLAQTSHFGLWDIIPPKSQLAFHIYYVKYENTLTLKRISWDSGEWCFKKKSVSYMYNTKSDHFSPKIKPYIYRNRKSNAKSYNIDQQRAYIWRWKHLIDFNFYQNNRQPYTVIPITTVRGPSLTLIKRDCSIIQSKDTPLCSLICLL